MSYLEARRIADQNALWIVPRALARNTAGPKPHRFIEHPAIPPIRISARKVHRPFEAAGQRLAQLIAGHEKAFIVRQARRVKLFLLRVGPIAS